MTIKVSAICNSEQTRAELAAASAMLPNVALVVHTGSAHLLAGILLRDKPDVVLLDFPTQEEKDIQQIETALLEGPKTHVVLVSPERSVEFLLRVMRAGVREVLASPMNLACVQQAVTHVQEHQHLGGTQAGQLGQVFAMVPAKGGAGSTFLATNLAFALSRQGKRVAVLDLNLYFGDAVIFLGDTIPKVTIVDLARKVDALDRALLESSMVKVSDRLQILVAPESPEYIGAVSTEALEKIVQVARSCYDYVVLDVSPTLEPLAVKALDLADHVHLVLQLNLPFVRATKRMVEVFRELGYSNEKIHVIVNRYVKGGDVTLTDVEKATLLKVNRAIPNSHVAVTASINQGIPLIELMPRDPVAQALHDWAQELVPVAQSEANGGLFSSLRRMLS